MKEIKYTNIAPMRQGIVKSLIPLFTAPTVTPLAGPCPKCKGFGKIGDKHRHRCDECHGTGWFGGIYPFQRED